MSKSLELKSHFQTWKQKHHPDVTFYEDGIINEELYSQAKYKLLFIAKEPNATNHDKGGFSSFCEEWNTSEPDYGFAFRIGEWATGILNDFPPFDSISLKQKYDGLKQIAFMNVKKSGGGGTVEDVKRFNELVSSQIEFIHHQIKVIEPEIIILSLSHSEFLTELLFPNIKDKWKPSGYQIPIARMNGYRIINYYHPSARNVAAAAYSLLQNVVRSERFRSL